MNSDRLHRLSQKLRELELEIDAELKREISQKKEELLCDFSKEKISLIRYIIKSKPQHILTAPVIYSMIIPAIIMDIFVSTYQAICFPAYGIAKVDRGDYIIIDRHKLPYLNILQKINCIYCGYFNGLIAYVKEIASRTELYWCPIKHSRPPREIHSYYLNFIDYGDGRELSNKIEQLREKLAKYNNN